MATNQFLTEQGAIEITLTAAADLSAKQYYAVKLDTDNKAALCGANEKALGILQNKPASGEQAVVRIEGITLCKVAEAVAFGNYLTPTAAGKAEVCDAADEDYFARSLGVYTTDDLAVVQLCFGEVESSDA